MLSVRNNNHPVGAYNKADAEEYSVQSIPDGG